MADQVLRDTDASRETGECTALAEVTERSDGGTKRRCVLRRTEHRITDK